MCTLKGYFSTNFHILYVQVSDVYTFLVGNEIMANCKKAPFKVRPNWMSQFNRAAAHGSVDLHCKSSDATLIDFKHSPVTKLWTSINSHNSGTLPRTLAWRQIMHKGFGHGFQPTRSSKLHVCSRDHETSGLKFRGKS